MKKTDTSLATRATRTSLDMRSFADAADSARREVRRVQALSTLAPHMLALPEVRKAYAMLTRALQAAYAAAPVDADTGLPALSPYAIQPWMTVSQSADEVRIGVSLRGLDSFKDASLMEVLTPFVGAPGWEASAYDYAFTQPNRDYAFTRMVTLFGSAERLPATLVRALRSAHTALSATYDDCYMPKEVKIIVRVYAYVKSDSPMCRVVVTGTTERVVREETKEIVCA